MVASLVVSAVVVSIGAVSAAQETARPPLARSAHRNPPPPRAYVAVESRPYAPPDHGYEEPLTKTALPAVTEAPTPSPSPATAASTPAPATAAPTPNPEPTEPPGGTAADPPIAGGSVAISAAHIATLPTSGAGWEAVAAAARGNWGAPDISSARDDDAVNVVAGALYAVRTGDAAMRTKVIAFLVGVQATPPNAGDVLAACRKLGGFVLAADLIGYHDPAFERWVTAMLDYRYAGGGGGGSIREVHERRPNNFGTHAFFARVAAATYLGDTADLQRAVRVHQAWIGQDVSAARYAGFEWGDLYWQSGPHTPIGITLPGDSHFANGGVLPDDQRRAGTSWTCENYVREALQGVLAGHLVLARNGYPDVWQWGQSAVHRAVKLQMDQGCAFEGDDAWQLWVVNRVYGTRWPTDPTPSPGKNFGWTDWLYGS
jgi:hypothetical protein